jgi:hypothetical protein
LSIVYFAVFFAAADPVAGDQPLSSNPRSRALLVGCTRYPLAAKIPSLEGPANDVELLAQTLIARFKMAPGDISSASRRGLETSW